MCVLCLQERRDDVRQELEMQRATEQAQEKLSKKKTKKKGKEKEKVLTDLSSVDMSTYRDDLTKVNVTTAAG